MAIFLYNGVQSGKKVTGEISASDLKSASVKLREKKIINKPELFFEISNQWHFTVSQKHQLDSLVRRINNFGVYKDIKCLLKDCKNSKSVISVLNKQIENHEVEWGRF